MGFKMTCRACGAKYHSQDSAQYGLVDLCPDCAMRRAAEMVEAERQAYLQDPYVRRVNDELIAEGYYLDGRSLSQVRDFRANELAGNYDAALEGIVLLGRPRFSRTMQAEEWRILQAKIDRYRKSGRYEDAALIFESRGHWEDAGKVRAEARRTKNINVDVNSLMDDLRQGGLGLQYKCRSCGAMLSAKGADGGLRFCSYCCCQVDTEAMERILRDALR